MKIFRFLKTILFLIILLIILLLVFGHKLPFSLPEPLKSWTAKFGPQSSSLITNGLSAVDLSEVSQNFQTLTTKSQVIQETVGKIASEAVKSDDQNQPLTEKALEYGRYIYCQQVVNEWQKAATSTPSATPSVAPSEQP